MSEGNYTSIEVKTNMGHENWQEKIIKKPTQTNVNKTNIEHMNELWASAQFYKVQDEAIS